MGHDLILSPWFYMAGRALLNAFKANKPAFGVWLSYPGIFHARTMAQASPHTSFVVVDCEHGLVPLVPGAAESISGIHSAANNNGPSALVRIPATGVSTSTSWQIKYALDAGARGVIVPMVSTAEKAREIAAESRFPPIGRRGFGSLYGPGNWGINPFEYLETANDNISVIAQIENKEGVENVGEIAAVNGIDALLVGPYDLSVALGYAVPDPDLHPEVEKITQRVLEACHRAGKKSVVYAPSGPQAAKRAAEGFDMIIVAIDVEALSDAISGILATAVSPTTPE
ncbi:hypothetical protein H0H92_015680 [Tricholoma furcatifolium]|nr:hypothetical protein H0H92_015680 [Tricholoma furcatifolium]